MEEKIFQLMSQPDYVPAKVENIGELLDLTGNKQDILKNVLRRLVISGAIVVVKKNRYCLPADADLIPGIIRFRQSGSAILIPDPENTRLRELGIAAGKERLFIPAEDTGVALHGDRVLARLVQPRRNFRRRRPGKTVVAYPPEDLRGRVIRILERARETLTGTLKKSRAYYYVIPDDPRIIQDILVPAPGKSGLSPDPRINDKVIVRLLEWKQRHLNPEGEIIAVLGKTHTPGPEYEALLHRYSLEPAFPPDVQQEAGSLPDKVRDSDIKGRLDLRDKFTFTIDPDDAKDFDDALSIEKKENGEIEVGVHIADVGAYVKPGCAIDKEAQKRGNSTYLVGTVIPMIPEALSNGLCSLSEGNDRLVKTALLTFNAKGRLGNVHYANSVINSKKRLTYTQAYAFMQGLDNKKIRTLPVPPAHMTGSPGQPLSKLSNEDLEQLRDSINQLWRLASKLRTSRMDRGSLDLDMPEIKIYTNAEGYADRIVQIENDESHQLIEEFMLAANEAVAKTLRRANLPTVYRVHDKPDADRLEELRDYLAGYQINVGDLTNRQEVSKFLRKIKDHPQNYTLKLQFLRSLKKAIYKERCDGHYGLHKENYLHFTSPIRRYPDLVTHRVLEHYLAKTGNSKLDGDPQKKYGQGEVTRLCQHLSLTEANSVEAERESQKLKLMEFFEREVGREEKSVFEAVITDVKNHGMFIELMQSATFGLVHISTLKDDLYRLNDSRTAIIGRRKNKTFFIGQIIKVVVERIDRYKRQIDFRLA